MHFETILLPKNEYLQRIVKISLMICFIVKIIICPVTYYLQGTTFYVEIEVHQTMT